MWRFPSKAQVRSEGDSFRSNFACAVASTSSHFHICFACGHWHGSMSHSPGRQSRSSKSQYLKRQASKGSAGSYTGYKDARASRKSTLDHTKLMYCWLSCARKHLTPSCALTTIINPLQRGCIPVVGWAAVRCGAVDLEPHKPGLAPMTTE